jgi:molybdopterin-guanine dinucleotide biosynthesis protein A
MNAYVLIGGRSRRMGVSKAELFLDRVVAAAAPVFDEVIAVQRADGQAARIRTIFEEPHEGEGAIFGVARALRDARDAAFVLAVDYAFITTDVLRFLRDDARVPMWDEQPQPLCAVWRTSALPRIEQRIARRALDLRGLLDREMIAEAELRARFDGEPLRNVNTPEDWHRG